MFCIRHFLTTILFVRMLVHFDPSLHFGVVDGRQLIHLDRPMLIMSDIHDDVAETTEFRPAEGFSEEITYHLVGWAIHDVDVPPPLHVGHKKSIECSYAVFSCYSIHVRWSRVALHSGCPGAPPMV